MGWVILPVKDVRDTALLEKKKSAFVNLMTSMLILHKTTTGVESFIIAIKSLQGGLD